LKHIETPRNPCTRETSFFRRLQDGKVQCEVCERGCTIAQDQTGFCGTKTNLNGKLYTLVYGKISSISANPIEKKPFFHYWPGSRVLTVGTYSCNLTCLWCQNWEISKAPPNKDGKDHISPTQLVQLARREKCQGISYSFNEPTLLLEHAVDTFPIARRSGLYCNYVSNGYMSVEALKALQTAGMDAIKFDVKGDGEAYRQFCNADVEAIWRNAGEARGMGMHVEVVTLVIPGVNDDEETIRGISRRVAVELGPETPLHFTRYYPAYRFTAPPTPVSTLEWARRVAKEEGCRYVYVGNAPGHPWENTICPACERTLIRRYGLEVVEFDLTPDHRCPGCGLSIPIVGRYTKH